MELYQLRTFIKIADAGSLARAAEQLYTSQPAVSAQIKALEEELGLPLFERAPKGMRLSAQGELLYGQAVATLEAAFALKTQALELRQEVVGDLRVGVHSDLDFLRIGDLHRRLAEGYQHISLHLTQGTTPQILADVRTGTLDGGFFFGPCRLADLALTPLARIPMSIVAPASWRKRVADIELPELAELPWVYTSKTCPFYALTNALFADVETELRKVAWVETEDAVRELIRAGAGLSLLRTTDAEQLEKENQAVCWKNRHPEIELGFAVRKQRGGEPVIRALVQELAALWGVEEVVEPEKIRKDPNEG